MPFLLAFRPYLLGAGLLALCAFAVWGWGAHQYTRGVADTEAMMEAEIARHNAFARAQEAFWRDQVHALDTKHTEELHRAKNEIERLSADLASGAKRLRIAIDKASVCASTNTPTASVDNASAYAQLDPAIAATLVRITQQGDQAIRQLTALQAWAKLVQLPPDQGEASTAPPKSP